MPDILGNLANLANQGSDKRNTPPKEAWRPQLELDSDGGYFVSTPRSQPVENAADLMAEFDLNPNDWIIVSVRRGKWQTYHGEWLESYRVNLKPASQRSSLVPYDDLERELKRWKPKAKKITSGNLTAIYNIGDTQWGKDAGDGTAGTIARTQSALESALEHHKTIAKRGIEQIALPQLGDCIEGTVSQGGRIMGRLDLDLTAQVRVGRRVLLEWVKAFAPLTDKLIIPVVPGNHDETTRQVIVDPMDSWQVEIVQQVLDICKEHPDLQHVEGRFPERDNTTLAVNFSGTMVGFAHGHQIRDAHKWWQGQSFGSPNEGVGAADVLITAHYHHYAVKQFNHRLWIQIPSLDGGSHWFADRTGLGASAPGGIVSLVVGDGYDSRRDLVVLS